MSALASESGFERAEDGTLIDGPLFTTDTPIDQFAIYTGVGAVMSVYDDTTPNAGVLQVIHEPGSVLCNSDLAFLVRDRALNVPIAPLRMTAPAVGEALTLVGYGLVDNSGVSFVRQQRAQTVLTVGPRCSTRKRITVSARRSSTSAKGFVAATAAGQCSPRRARSWASFPAAAAEYATKERSSPIASAPP